MFHDTISSVSCLAKSSQPCSYRWKWVDGVHELIVSNDAVLTPSSTGWYKCEAQCNIRGKQCTVLSKLVHVLEQTRTCKKLYLFIRFLAYYDLYSSVCELIKRQSQGNYSLIIVAAVGRIPQEGKGLRGREKKK